MLSLPVRSIASPFASMPNFLRRLIEHRFRRFAIAFGWLILGSVAPMKAMATEEVAIGSRVELFADDYLVAKLNGDAHLVAKQPVAREVVFRADKSWEGSSSLYFTIFRDGPRFRMYYRGTQVRDRKLLHPEFTCYAESHDGIHWQRPTLGLVEFNGSKQNNILLQGIGAHNFTAFRDTNPDARPEARYKAVGRGVRTPDGKIGTVHQLFAFQSADGIHWQRMQEQPILTDGRFDSQNVAFWDGTRRQYVCYFRDMLGGYRAIRSGLSNDFLSWKDVRFIGFRGAERRHLYTNAIQRYDRAPHMLIGFPTQFLPRQQFPDRPDWTEPLFIAGRDGDSFKMWPKTIIPNLRPEQQGNRGNYVSWGLVRLPSEPGRYSLYASEARRSESSMRLRRYTYRRDGFVAAQAQKGELITHPFTFTGNRLLVNFKTRPKGYLRVEIQDSSGETFPNWSLSTCQKLSGDKLTGEVKWKGTLSLEKLVGRLVRARFEIRDAEIYSFQFEE